MLEINRVGNEVKMAPKKTKVFFITLLLCLMATGVYASAEYNKATFAGGCFWCMEPPFEKLDGVVTVLSGYTGGHTKNPTYEEASSGTTGHVESVQITYDPAKVSYDTLLQTFWQQIDPTDSKGQFVDRGFQYTSAIFYHSEPQRIEAKRSKAALEASKRFSSPIVTRIVKAKVFYPAEEYHQDYYKKSLIKYKYYRYRSGRDQFLDKVWGKERGHISSGYIKPARAELRARLTPLQFRVTQEDATERPFKNSYWDNKSAGLYVDIVSGEPLFSSSDKFVSGTGWPSFTRSIDPQSIIEKEDRGFFGTRTELRSAKADSHLGHLFNDGPAPTGQRYCINSASLRFVPVDELEEQGFGQYKNLFEEAQKR